MSVLLRAQRCPRGEGPEALTCDDVCKVDRVIFVSLRHKFCTCSHLTTCGHLQALLPDVRLDEVGPGRRIRGSLGVLARYPSHAPPRDALVPAEVLEQSPTSVPASTFESAAPRAVQGTTAKSAASVRASGAPSTGDSADPAPARHSNRLKALAAPSNLHLRCRNCNHRLLPGSMSVTMTCSEPRCARVTRGSSGLTCNGCNTFFCRECVDQMM